MDNLHISLAKTFYLERSKIENYKEEMQYQTENFMHNGVISLKMDQIFAYMGDNDQLFLGINVENGFKVLDSYVDQVDKI